MYWTQIYRSRASVQKIELRRNRQGFYLLLDGRLEFHSADAHRHHEALVHPAARLGPSPREVLVVGDGCGLAVREVLRYRTVRRVVLVDADPELAALPARFPPLAALAAHALADPRLETVHAEASEWLAGLEGGRFDLVVLHLPEPRDDAAARCYTLEVFAAVARSLSREGRVAVRGPSLDTRAAAFWCIADTMQAAGLCVVPYEVASPRLGLVPFLLAAPRALRLPPAAPPGLRFLDDGAMKALFALGRDRLERPPAAVHRASSPVLPALYRDVTEAAEPLPA